MKLGISTACLYPLETEKALEKVAESGIELTEIFFNAECELEDGFVRQLEKTIREYGVKISAVHPTMSLAETFMLFSDYRRRYDKGLSDYKRYAEIAAKLGARYVVMHGGKPNRVMNDDGYFDRFSGIAGAVKENGALLLQENVANYRAGNLTFLKNMYSAFGDEAAFCLDIKQCIRGGYSPFDALETLRGSIKHLHISDNSSQDDCMLPLNGDFDFKAFFSKAYECGYCGDAVVEVYRWAYDEYSEIFDSCDRLKRLINI